MEADLTTGESHAIAKRVSDSRFHAAPRLADVLVHPDPVADGGIDHHAITAHHDRDDD